MRNLRQALTLYILVTGIIALIVLLIPRHGAVDLPSNDALLNRISTTSRR